ncbi:nicotinate-nicotinamide nucleotide adenylyltransferase, partial [Mesotoga sp.]
MCSKTRIGIFGGSFDPVHTGHLVVAIRAIEQLELDRLYVIPAYMPPHKVS